MNATIGRDDSTTNYVPKICPACASNFVVGQTIDVVRNDLSEVLVLNGEEYRPQTLHYARCSHCDSILAIDRRRTPGALAGGYESLEAGYWAALTPHNSTFANQLVAALPVEARHGDLWDVGCGDGALLEALKGTWKCHGIEPGRNAVLAALARGIDARQGTAPSLDLKEVADVVVSVDVVEHLEQPSTELDAMVRMLRPGGWLALVTAASDSITSRIAGPQWYYLHCLGHLTVFSRSALSDAVSRTGLTNVRSVPIQHGGSVSSRKWVKRLMGNSARWLLRRPLAPVFNFRDHQLVLGQRR